jgi:thrombospondin type 3 repeat protein
MKAYRVGHAKNPQKLNEGLNMSMDLNARFLSFTKDVGSMVSSVNSFKSAAIHGDPAISSPVDSSQGYSFFTNHTSTPQTDAKISVPSLFTESPLKTAQVNDFSDKEFNLALFSGLVIFGGAILTATGVGSGAGAALIAMGAGILLTGCGARTGLESKGEADPHMADANADGIGDKCQGDADTDGDGIPNAQDNCLNVANPDQLDTDHNCIGDACDPNAIGDKCQGDTDGDGISDCQDNCPLISNPDQLDTNGDGIGDKCQGDADGDGIPDCQDNCPLISNPDQLDTNGDGIGDKCQVGCAQ